MERSQGKEKDGLGWRDTRVTERERWSRMERQRGLQKEKDGLGWRDNEGENG